MKSWRMYSNEYKALVNDVLASSSQIIVWKGHIVMNNPEVNEDIRLVCANCDDVKRGEYEWIEIICDDTPTWCNTCVNHNNCRLEKNGGSALCDE